jgi:hypothetical protein
MVVAVNAPTPERPGLRISDADRERAVERLNEAVSEGRLTMVEFEDRVRAVLAARIAGDLAPHLADLPGQAGTPAGPEHGELRTTMSNLKRKGRWMVPRRLAVHSKAGSVTLDFTDAVISHPVIEVALEVYFGTTTLILPPGASANIEQVEFGMVASNTKIGKVPVSDHPTGDPHVVVTGKQWAGTLVIRHQRRFLHWRW